MKLFQKILSTLAIQWTILFTLIFSATNPNVFSLGNGDFSSGTGERMPVFFMARNFMHQMAQEEKNSTRHPSCFLYYGYRGRVKLCLDLHADESLQDTKVFLFTMMNQLHYNTPRICFKFPLSEHTEEG